MFEEHPVFKAPDDTNIQIWRYMDLPKYISIIDQSALYFSRSDRLGDEFEGSLPKPNVLARSVNPILKRTGTASDGTVETIGETMSRLLKIGRTHAFVNCWHMSHDESAAMWQLYCSDIYGVAIRSTYSALCASFSTHPHPVYVGVVEYIDYDREPIPDGNTFYPLVHKRRSYQHEKELRAIVTWKPPGDPLKAMWQEPEDTGILVRVDLARLIGSVFVASNAPTWFFEVVRSVSAKYGLTAPLQHSRLGEKPLF